MSRTPSSSPPIAGRQAARRAAGGRARGGRRAARGRRRARAVRAARSMAAAGVPVRSVDALGREEARGPQEQPLERHLALEVALGERRALVGEVGLGADQGERAGVAEGAELRHQRGAGLARAHHDDPRRLRLHPAPFAVGFAPRPSICRGVRVLQPREGRAMTIETGGRLPEATFLEKGAGGDRAGAERRALRRPAGGALRAARRLHRHVLDPARAELHPRGGPAAGEGGGRDRLRLGQRPARDAGLERGDRRRRRRIRMLADADGAFARALGPRLRQSGAPASSAARSAMRSWPRTGW